ncbi:MAG: hypothetical protein ACI9FR_002944 [Cryomorphaceae bacterium]|jgi:hypothetical protein
MKDNETEYLNKLFTKSSSELDESEIDFPLVDVPADLSNQLYAITGPALSSSGSIKQGVFKSWSNKAWPKFASVAASLLMAVVLLQVYQQNQTLNQLEQAQADLTTALHYLGEANKITQTQMLNALNANMKKAAFAPVIEIGRDAAIPTVESLESATKRPHRTL